MRKAILPILLSFLVAGMLSGCAVEEPYEGMYPPPDEGPYYDEDYMWGPDFYLFGGYFGDHFDRFAGHRGAESRGHAGFGGGGHFGGGHFGGGHFGGGHR